MGADGRLDEAASAFEFLARLIERLDPSLKVLAIDDLRRDSRRPQSRREELAGASYRTAPFASRGTLPAAESDTRFVADLRTLGREVDDGGPNVTA